MYPKEHARPEKLNLSQAIPLFLNWCRVERNLAAKTINAYQHDLTVFARFLKSQEYPVSKIGSDTIEKFLNDLSNHSAAAIARKISCLKTFFNFLMMKRKIQNNPTACFGTPKNSGRKIPVFLTEAELTQFINYLEARAERVKIHSYIQDKAIVTVLAFTGLRVSELTKLNWEDIDFGAKNIKVSGKGGNQRLVPLLPEAATALIQLMGLGNFLKTGPVFTQKNKRITSWTIEMSLPQLAAESGITKRITPHKLRHTYATLLYKSGADLLGIKDLLGHKSISTTQVYTHTDSARLYETANRISLHKQQAIA